MRISILTLTILLLAPFSAEACPNLQKALGLMANHGADAEARSEAAQCLVRSHMGEVSVEKVLLRALKDPQEDLFLKEDILSGLAAISWRKQIVVEGNLGPTINEEQRQAIGRTVAGAESLLAVTQAVKRMNETLSTVALETEFYRTLSDLALDEKNHVVTRMHAVQALEQIALKANASGLYQDRNLKTVRETLQLLQIREENVSAQMGVSGTALRMARAGVPGFDFSNRQIASTVNQ